MQSPSDRMPFLWSRRRQVDCPLFNLAPFPYEDNGYRVEITVGRPSFLFEISSGEVISFVGGREVCRLSSSSSAPRRLKKRRSNISVLTVYDTYGMDITHSYLKRIYETKFYRSGEEWLVAYLAGSYVAPTGEASPFSPTRSEAKDGVVMLISLILLELVQREQEKLKLTYQLEEVKGIPPEIIARITGSSRLSKEVSKQVRSDACNIIPSVEEVIGLSRTSLVRTLDQRSRLLIGDKDTDPPYAYSITILDDNTFDLNPEAANARLPRAGITASLHDYHFYSRSNGCDWNKLLDVVLDNLRMLVPSSPDTRREVCAWILQIYSDLGYGTGEEEDDSTSSSRASYCS